VAQGELLAAAAEAVRTHALSAGVRDALFALTLGGELEPSPAHGRASHLSLGDARVSGRDKAARARAVI
jgi:hypothetical protein